MKMVKMAGVMICAVCMGALAFAGGQKETSAMESGKPVEIAFWSCMTGKNGTALQKIVDDYNARQSAVHVTLTYQGSYYDMASKLQIGVTSGDIPDIAQVEMESVKTFADYGILVDMSKLAKKAGLDTSAFYPGLMTCLDWGKGLYGIPFNRSTPMFYYNRDMFKQAGLDPDKPPKNWQELRSYAQKLSIPGKRWGYEMPIDSWFYEAFIMQSGGQILNSAGTDIAFNNEKGTAPLKLWKSMIAEGSMKAPPGAEYDSWDAARSDFQSGITGMIVTSSGSLGSLQDSCKFNIGTCFLPANTRYGVPTGGANLVMLTGHEKRAAAGMDFIKYVASPEVSAYWAATTGYVPTSEAAANTKTYQDYLVKTPAGRTALEQLKKYTDIPRPVNARYQEIHAEVMMSQIQKCMQEADYTPEETVAAISQQARAILSK